MPQRKRFVVAATLTGLFATGFPVTILTVVLPGIARGYGVSTDFLTWAITGPMLVMATATPVFGKIGDVFGHRRVFLISLAGSAALALLTAAAPTALALIGLRIASQTFGAAAMPSSLALIMRVHEPEDRGRASGWWSMVGAGAPVTGLVAGGPLAEALGWRSVFIVQAVLTFAALAMAIPMLPKGEVVQRVKVDYLGAVLLTAGVLGILFAVNEAPATGVSVLLVVTFLAGVAATVLFVRRQLRIAHPLIDLAFFRNPEFILPIAVLFSIFFGYMGGFVLTPIYIGSALPLSVFAISMVMMCRPIALSLISPIWVRLPAAWASRGPLAGGVLSVGAMGAFALGAADHNIMAFVIGNLLNGLGLGMAQPDLTAKMINAVHEDEQGSAGGQQAMATQIGAVLGISVMSGVAAGHPTSGSAPSYVLAYVIAAAASVAAVLLAVHLSRYERKRATRSATARALLSVTWPSRSADADSTV